MFPRIFFTLITPGRSLQFQGVQPKKTKKYQVQSAIQACPKQENRGKSKQHDIIQMAVCSFISLCQVPLGPGQYKSLHFHSYPPSVCFVIYETSTSLMTSVLTYRLPCLSSTARTGQQSSSVAEKKHRDEEEGATNKEVKPYMVQKPLITGLQTHSKCS